MKSNKWSGIGSRRLGVHFGRSFAVISLLAAAILAVPLFATSPQDPTAAAIRGSDDTRILEVVIDNVQNAEDVAAAAAGLGQAVSKLSGCTTSVQALGAEENGIRRVIRATVWKDVTDAEAASLALDGLSESTRMLKAVEPATRQTAHFRLLRENVYSQEPSGHIEVVIFRTKPGATRESNLKLFDGAEADFASGEGLRAHSLWIAPDGRWVHLLRWGSAADYEKTGKALFKMQGVGSWIRSLDFKRFTVTRGDVLPIPADK